MAALKDLLSGEALTLYGGALLGFYGSRALHSFLVTPAVKAIFKVDEGVARKGMKDPANYTEVTDIVVGVTGVMLVKNLMLKRGILAGAALSLIDHILDRFPDVQAKIPGA